MKDLFGSNTFWYYFYIIKQTLKTFTMTTVIATNNWNKATEKQMCIPTGIKTMGGEVFQIGNDNFAAGEFKHNMFFASFFMSKTSKSMDFSFEDAVNEFEKSCNNCINGGWQEEWAIEGLKACKDARIKHFANA